MAGDYDASADVEQAGCCDGAGYGLVSLWVSMWSAVHRVIYHGGCARCCQLRYTGEMGLWVLRESGVQSQRESGIVFEGYCCDTCGYVRTSGACVAIDEADGVPVRTRNVNGLVPWATTV